MDEWPTVRIEDIAQRIAMGPFGSNIKTDNFVEVGVPVIRGGNLNSTRLDMNGFAFLTESKAHELSNSNAFPGDLVFTHRGTLGQVGIIPDKPYPRYVVSQSQMLLSCDKSKAVPEFVFYFFKSPVGQSRLLANRSQTGVPAIARPTSSLKSVKIPLPSIDEQAAIANVLSSLDDKIELNRQMNATLEAMVQAIFRDWFVDFSPIRRQIHGAIDPLEILGGLIPDPIRAGEIAALFPKALDDAGLPIGWATSTLDRMLNLAYGKALPKTARVDGKIPVYGSGGIGGRHNVALLDGPAIIVGRKGTVGSLFWEPGGLYPIDTVFFVEPKQGYSLHFLWQLLQTLRLETMNTDAAVPGLNRHNAHRLLVVRASQPVLDAFSNLALLIRSKIDAGDAESRTLAETRDYLLPRLMSGRVRIADAQRMAS